MKRTSIFVERQPIIIPRVIEPNVENPYGYIYLTTNLINHKKYIGQHKPNTERNYKGSGTILKQAFSKYGKHNFSCEIIDWASTEEQLNQKEIWWIDFLGCVESDNWYNLMEGGNRGPTMYGKDNPMYGVHIERDASYYEKLSKSMMGHSVSEHCKDLLREAMYKNIKRGLYIQTGKNNPFYGKTHTEELKQHWRKTKRTPVVQLDLDGNYVAEYDSMSQPEMYGFEHIYISNCCKGIQKKHKGYKWMYKSEYYKEEQIDED